MRGSLSGPPWNSTCSRWPMSSCSPPQAHSHISRTNGGSSTDRTLFRSMYVVGRNSSAEPLGPMFWAERSVNSAQMRECLFSGSCTCYTKQGSLCLQSRPKLPSDLVAPRVRPRVRSIAVELVARLHHAVELCHRPEAREAELGDKLPVHHVRGQEGHQVRGRLAEGDPLLLIAQRPDGHDGGPFFPPFARRRPLSHTAAKGPAGLTYSPGANPRPRNARGSAGLTNKGGRHHRAPSPPRVL